MRTGGVGASAATVAADGADATDAAAASLHAGQALAQGLCGDSMCVAAAAAAAALAAAAAAAAAYDDAARAPRQLSATAAAREKGGGGVEGVARGGVLERVGDAPREPVQGLARHSVQGEAQACEWQTCLGPCLLVRGWSLWGIRLEG